jgi:phosphatidate cytidylyltransferase
MLAHYFAVIHPQTQFFPYLLVLVGSVIVTAVHLPTQQGAIANLGLTIFGFLYVTLPLSFLIDMNFLPSLNNHPSSFWLVFLLIVTKGSDIFAYIVGKTLGKHLLAEKLSPKKTIEGAVAGIVGAALLAVVTARYAGAPLGLSTHDWYYLGGLLGIAALLGDLTESLFKRDAGVKDSNIIPGIGGILDLVDSLTFSAPLLYLYLVVTHRLGMA